jgi:glucose/arabinose dehydrogenase
VLIEWTLDPSTMTASSPRQILRWPQLYAAHGPDALVFDQATKLLYIGVGDGGKQGDPFDVAQNPNYLYGKVLRIDPTEPDAILPSNMARADTGTYSYPIDNPYAAPGDSGRDSIYVIGLRHPETMIKDGAELLVFDIGGANFDPLPPIEEVNVLKLDGDEGKNFGWDIVAGRFPTNTSTEPPVAGYGHPADVPLTAIIGGAAPESGPFAGKVILGDIVSGEIFYGDRVAMKQARSWSTPMVPLQQFVMHNAGGTPRTLMAAFGRNSRVDLRLTEIDSGRVIGVSKQKGIVFEIFPL